MQVVRTREYGVFLPGSYTFRSYANPATPGVITNTGTFGTLDRFGEHGTMSDTVTPNFKQLVNNGVIVNEPMSKSICASSILEVSNATLSNANGTKNEYTGDYIGAFVDWVMPGIHSRGSPESFGVFPNSLRSQATINALKSVTQANSMVGVVAGELRQTVSMITNTAGGFGRAIQAIASGSPKKAVLKLLMGANYKEPRRQTWKTGSTTVGKKWLEIRYGWTPLLYEVEGALAALNAVHQRRFTARGFAKDSGTKQTLSSKTVDGSFGHQVHTRLDEQYETNVRAYVLYDVRPEWLTPNKLGLFSPLATAWELVPFSFVLDWFVNIGDWLDAMTPRIGVRYLAQGIVEEGKYEAARLCTSTTSGSGSSATGFVGSGWNFYTRWKVRNIGLQLPPLPPIDVRVNIKRATDAIALFAQQARRVR